MAFRLAFIHKTHADFSAHAKTEDRKLRKDLTFGGPCFEGTLQKPTGVSESSPVAGAIKGINPFKPLDAGRAREMHKHTSSQPHSLGSLFIADEQEKAQGGIENFRGDGYEVCSRLVQSCPKGSSSSPVPSGICSSAALRDFGAFMNMACIA